MALQCRLLSVIWRPTIVSFFTKISTKTAFKPFIHLQRIIRDATLVLEMEHQKRDNVELYNLRWNSYSMNLIKLFSLHQKQEALTDVCLSTEGRFINAHRLVLSACSNYFQRIFENQKTPNLMIWLDGVKFKHLELILHFMYSGEVKVANCDLQELLALGKRMQVKGLCAIDFANDRKQSSSGVIDVKADHDDKPVTKKVIPPPLAKTNEPPVKKKKLTPSIIRKPPASSSSSSPMATNNEAACSGKKKDGSTTDVHIPRPPNAFMIFANQWRKKLAVEYLHESNKDISVRLGNMWKTLSIESKDQFYQDAKKADEEHKIKYPGYYYSPMEARHRKSQLQKKVDTKAQPIPVQNEEDNKIEIKQEIDDEEGDEDLLKLMIDDDKC